MPNSHYDKDDVNHHHLVPIFNHLVPIFNHLVPIFSHFNHLVPLPSRVAGMNAVRATFLHSDPLGFTLPSRCVDIFSDDQHHD